jgi:hypothetical protein
MPLWLPDPVYAVPRRRRVVLTSTPVIWYAHYDTTTGDLLSLGTVVPDPLPDGTAVHSYTTRPDLAVVVWDTTTRDFIPLDPPTVVDRVTDLEADSGLTSVWATLDATQDQALKDRIGQLLGPFRNRYVFQPTDLESGNPGTDE